MSAVLIKIIPIADQPRTIRSRPRTPSFQCSAPAAPTLQTWIELARTYVNYGSTTSCWRRHLLFVLGLIWIVGGGWRLVKTITVLHDRTQRARSPPRPSADRRPGTPAQRLHCAHASRSWALKSLKQQRGEAA